MYVHNPKDLGGAIKERRKVLKMSQQTLADRALVSRQWLIAVEHGKTGAELGLVFQVLHVLGIRLSVTNSAPNEKQGSHIDLDAIVNRYTEGAR